MVWQQTHRRGPVSAGDCGQCGRVHRRQQRRHRVALQAETGRELWRASVGAPLERRRRQRRALCRGRHPRERTGRARGRPPGLAQEARRARQYRAAGCRRARLRARQRPQRAGLRCARRPPAVGDPALRRSADAGAARRHRRLQGYPAGRPGSAAGRARSRTMARCAGKSRWPRRAAPTRSSGWPIWSARRCASAKWSARARSRPRSPASMPNAARSAGPRTSAAPTAWLPTSNWSPRPTHRTASSAWKTGSGEVAWSSEKLLYRATRHAGDRGRFGGLRRCLGHGALPVEADGATQLRLPTDGSGIVGTPVVVGKTVLVVTRAGGLFALARRVKRTVSAAIDPAQRRDETGHRDRRAAQCRQVDVVQPHDEKPRRDRRRLFRPDPRPPLRRRPARRARIHRRRYRRLRARQHDRHRPGDGASRRGRRSPRPMRSFSSSISAPAFRGRTTTSRVICARSAST